MARIQFFLDSLGAQQTVRQQMESVANNLRLLPEITNPQMPELVHHIQAVKTHAYDFLSSLSTEMNYFYDETMSYGEDLEKTADQVLAQLKPGQAGGSTVAVALFGPVLDAGKTIEISLNQLCKDIGAFDDNISADARSLLSDRQKANQLLSGDEARLHALNTKLHALREELESKRRAEILVGIFTFGIGAAIMELTNFVESAEDDIRGASRQAIATHQQEDQLLATCSSLTSFTNGTAVLSGLAVNLGKDWQTVVVGLEEITDQEVPDSFIEAAIKSILADWKQVAEMVERLKKSPER